jgi:hypothetical protein
MKVFDSLQGCNVLHFIGEHPLPTSRIDYWSSFGWFHCFSWVSEAATTLVRYVSVSREGHIPFACTEDDRQTENENGCMRAATHAVGTPVSARRWSCPKMYHFQRVWIALADVPLVRSYVSTEANPWLEQSILCSSTVAWSGTRSFRIHI